MNETEKKIHVLWKLQNVSVENIPDNIDKFYSKGELKGIAFYKNLIDTCKDESVYEQYPDSIIHNAEREKAIIDYCEKKICKLKLEKYWVFRKENFYTLINIIIGLLNIVLLIRQIIKCS